MFGFYYTRNISLKYSDILICIFLFVFSICLIYKILYTNCTVHFPTHLTFFAVEIYLIIQMEQYITKGSNSDKFCVLLWVTHLHECYAIDFSTKNEFNFTKISALGSRIVGKCCTNFAIFLCFFSNTILYIFLFL